MTVATLPPGCYWRSVSTVLCLQQLAHKLVILDFVAKNVMRDGRKKVTIRPATAEPRETTPFSPVVIRHKTTSVPFSIPWPSSLEITLTFVGMISTISCYSVQPSSLSSLTARLLGGLPTPLAPRWNGMRVKHDMECHPRELGAPGPLAPRHHD